MSDVSKDQVLIPEQREVQVFENEAGNVTLLHPWLSQSEDEQVVVIPMDYVPALIRRLHALYDEARGLTDPPAPPHLRVVEPPSPDGAA